MFKSIKQHLFCTVVLFESLVKSVKSDTKSDNRIFYNDLSKNFTCYILVIYIGLYILSAVKVNCKIAL